MRLVFKVEKREIDLEDFYILVYQTTNISSKISPNEASQTAAKILAILKIEVNQ